MRVFNLLRTTFFLFLLTFLGYLPTVSGQATATYGNEWINPNQSYFKIKVVKNGMHRVTFAELSALGITNVNPEKFQLFRRGQEVAIYVNGQSDQVLNAGDYIDFYGVKNDGKTDNVLYKNPANQLHSYYSLFTDTAAYFLTFGSQNGKRMQVKTSNTSGLTPDPYHYTEILRLYTNAYSAGKVASTLINPSWGELAEGFTSSVISKSRKDTISGISNPVALGRAPFLEAGVSGGINVNSQHQIKFLVSPPGSPRRTLMNNQTSASGVIAFPFMNYRRPKFELLNSDFSSAGVLTLRAAVADSAVTSPPDWVHLAYYKLTYARTNNLNSKNGLIITDSTKTTPSYFLFDNPPANAVAYDITDPLNVIRTEGVLTGVQQGFVFDPSTKPRRVLIVNEQNNISVAGAVRIRFKPMNPAVSNYIIITHSSLRTPAAGTTYTDPPKDYALYRASVSGGGYNPIVLDIDSLYDQFHYGEKSPQAITNLMRYYLANGQPKFLLLLGKGLDQNDVGLRVNPNNPVYANRGRDLIPAAGFPASDILFTSNWKNGQYFPLVPTGRLSATSSADIASYLDKVKAQEALGVEEWRKNILHLGGGHTPTELSTFKRYLDNYKGKVEGPFLGASVKTIQRPDFGTVTTINVKSEVNAGLSLITFFGHSSLTVSDLDIGLVSDPINGYANLNKYPMLLMNGCGAGNAFQLKSNTTKKYSFGEDWVLTPKKGAIAFLASPTYALPYALNNFSSSFYRIAFTDSVYYGEPVGIIHQKSIDAATKLASPTDFSNITTVTQMTLQGDPALKLFAPQKPDYLVKQGGLKLQTDGGSSNVTADNPSFDLVIDVQNLGKAIDSSLVVSVKRILPNGDSIRITQKLPPVYNASTLKVKIDNKGVNSFGSNTFEVTLDYGNRIDELNETNNKAILNRYFSASGVLALFPTEYGIVNTQNVKLVGQPANLLIGARDYYFELDTVPGFNSGFKKSAIVRNAAVKPTWATTLLPGSAPNDSIVYYWRFRFNTFTAKEDTIWATSSFRYIPASPEGWSQSHNGQFSKATKTDISINENTNKWEYTKTFREMRLKTAGGKIPFTIPGPHGILVDNAPMWQGTCVIGAGVLVTVYSNIDLKHYTASAYSANSCNVSFYRFALGTPGARDIFVNFMQSIPNGFYVSLISMENVLFSQFTQPQKDAFKLIGSKLIDSLQSGNPFAIVGQKGSPNGILLNEKTFDPALSTPADSQAIAMDVNISGRLSEGKIVSTRIGPATSWTTLHHTVKKFGSDQYELDLFGFDKNGNRTLIASDIKPKTYSLSSVDANVYPYLQLQLTSSDTLERTPPQLKQWMVVYQGVPEGMIRPDLASINQTNINKQAVNGNVNLRFAFSNISNRDFGDSLTIIRSVAGSRPMQDTIKVKKLVAGDSVYFDYNFSTGGMKGNNMIRVDVNPQILPEQYYFNNFLEVPFTMPNADLHPTLDVAFDGVHIMDGDIVSPSPKIAINLKDEDKYDYVTDPDKLEVFLLRPGALNYERIALEDASLVTLPDLSDPGRDKRDFNITYNPKNLPDGIYKLRVQGSDNSNHTAGFEPYSISFEVINESAVTHFYPYPNPFTSNTRFVFTLTGNPENIPRNLKIQVMTLTGKVVREIQKEELGLVKVGNNISAPWDGTDEFGDKLANGTYLYRVVMEKAPLEEMKHRRTAGDKSFNKEYGKLYILR